MSIAPLILLWMLARSGQGAPIWPTPAAPPPRKPATKPPVRSRAAAPAAPAAPAPPHPVDLPAPPEPAPFQAAAPKDITPPPIAPTPDLRVVQPGPEDRPAHVLSVLEAQKILNTHGAKPRLAQDGLYGPKTHNAWRAAAQRANYDPALTRQGPKTVAVNKYTYDFLRSTKARVVGAVYIP